MKATITAKNSTARPGCTIILGADGATWNVIHRMLKHDPGALPNFRRVMESGAFGPLESIENMRSASAWTSMFTGYNPGKHGIYEFYEFLPQTYSLKYIHGGYKHVPGLWTYFDRAGKSTGIINTPMTYPAEATQTAGGYMIAGLDGPGKQSPRFGFPDDFITRLEKKMGCEYVIEPGLTGAIAKGRPEEAAELLKNELDSKHRALLVMLDEIPVDCLMFVFRSLDAAQHCFWKWMDPTHPKHRQCSSEDIRRFGRVIDSVYEKLDVVIGDILQRIDLNRDHLMIISDHGFGQKCPVSSQLNRWLAAQGYLHYLGQAGKASKPNAASKALKFVASHTSRSTKEKLARMLPGVRNWAQSKALFSGVDWSRTRVYSDAQFPRLRINIKGREGEGIVDQADAPALMEELRSRLREMRDSQTDEPIVRDVFFNHEIYRGTHTGPGEDILVRWREDIVIHGVRMPAGHEMPADEELSVMPGEDPKVISGDHQIHGIFLGIGPAFKNGAPIEDGLRLLDMTPTILHVSGLPIPNAMAKDSKVMIGAMREDWLREHPVRFVDDALSGPDQAHSSEEPSTPYSEADQKVLEDRLRSLGYIE